MNLIYESKYKNSVKNIKNRHKESATLDKIINHIKQCLDFNELSNSPISLMYGFEPLKYDLKGYYSFNLNKNSGKIRLIFKSDNKNKIYLCFVSVQHYDDFKNKL